MIHSGGRRVPVLPLALGPRGSPAARGPANAWASHLLAIESIEKRRGRDIVKEDHHSKEDAEQLAKAAKASGIKPTAAKKAPAKRSPVATKKSATGKPAAKKAPAKKK